MAPHASACDRMRASRHTNETRHWYSEIDRKFRSQGMQSKHHPPLSRAVFPTSLSSFAKKRKTKFDTLKAGRCLEVCIHISMRDCGSASNYEHIQRIETASIFFVAHVLA